MKRNIAAVLLVGSLTSAVFGGHPAGSQRITFSRDVLPVLTKMQCNTAKCHGSLQGTGSLRLSPLGSDPRGDYYALARESGGRRVSAIHPRESLLLRRLTSSASTVRLKPDSPTFAILHDWMQQGAVGPTSDEPRLLRLDVSPDAVRLVPGETADITVRATWSDGVDWDVTQWATFHSDTEDFATVDKHGRVSAVEPGFAAVQARFLHLTVGVRVLVPTNDREAAFTWTPNNLVDHYVAATWRAAGLQPADVANDYRFSRRVHLQLTGVPPTLEQHLAFLADDRPDKRQRLIDRLLASPRYAGHWAETWSRWLLEDRWVDYGEGDWRQSVRTPKHPQDRQRLRSWLTDELQQNVPVDQLAGDVLTANGHSVDSGASVFYSVHATPDDMARASARSLLGLTVACSRCHDHPHAPWTAKDFANLSACFADVRVERCVDGTRVRELKAAPTGTGGVTRDDPDASVAVDGCCLPRRPLAEQLAALKFTFQLAAESPRPREALAAWIAGGGRQLLARNVVNRYWRQLFKRPLVGPPDDLHAANPGSHPELLEALTRDFLAHGCDVQHLLRTICNSRLYQLDSEPKPGSEQDDMLFSRFWLQRFGTDHLRRVIEAATTARIKPQQNMQLAGISPLVEDPIQCSRDSYRSDDQPLGSYLYMPFSQDLETALGQPGSLSSRMIKSDKSLDAVSHELYLAIMCRPPNDDERKQIQDYIEELKQRQEFDRKRLIEDITWALLNTKEFLFIH